MNILVRYHDNNNDNKTNWYLALTGIFHLLRNKNTPHKHHTVHKKYKQVSDNHKWSNTKKTNNVTLTNDDFVSQ